MRAAFDLSMLLITHDLGVIAGSADRVAVMYAGRIVEQGPVRELFRAPAHPYTHGLLASIPGGAPGRRLNAIEGTVPPLADTPRGLRVRAAVPRRDRRSATPRRRRRCLAGPRPRGPLLRRTDSGRRRRS